MRMSLFSTSNVGHNCGGLESDSMQEYLRVSKTHESSSLCVIFLYTLAMVWGLAPFSLRNNRVSQKSLWARIYPIIYAVCCVCGGVYSLMNWINLKFVRGTNLKKFAEIFASEIALIAVVLSVMKFYRDKNTILDVMNLFSKVDRTLLSVGIRQDYQKEFKALAVRVGTTFCAITITDYICEVAFWHTMIPFQSASSMYLQGIYRCTLHTVFIIFFNTMMAVDMRLGQLNQRLTNLFEMGRGMTLVRLRGDDNFGNHNIIVQIEIVHSQLHNIIEKIVGIFCLPVTAVIGAYSLNILNCCFFTYNMLPKLLIDLDYETVFQTAGTYVWTLVKVLELFAVAHACSSIQKTGKSTTVALHEMWTKYHPDELRDEVQDVVGANLVEYNKAGFLSRPSTKPVYDHCKSTESDENSAVGYNGITKVIPRIHNMQYT